MMKLTPACLILFLLLGSSLLTNCGSSPTEKDRPSETTNFRLAFGSCAHQDRPQPLLDVATGLEADVFIFLGDNIYGDSYEIDSLRARYERLAARPEFKRLKAATPLLATWDDHDYGWNDAGRHYPLKEESKQLFLKFWEVPDTSQRYDHPGIYGVEWLERAGKRVQIILLDTRTFRDDLLYRAATDSLHKNDYVPNKHPDSTLLGVDQWAWLAKQFKLAADARIIATSNQFGHSYNGWESWTNLPLERQRMIDLIVSSTAENVFFISGDVHWGELSKVEVPGREAPLYDLTSSGINRDWDVIEPNDNRVGPAIPQHNVGYIDLRFGAEGGQAYLALVDSSGQDVVQQTVDLQP